MRFKPGTTPEQTKQIEKALSAIAEELNPLVDAIEASTPTTQNHYGQYLNIFSGMNRDIAKLTLWALTEKTKANKQGVRDAYRICFGGAS